MAGSAHQVCLHVVHKINIVGSVSNPMCDTDIDVKTQMIFWGGGGVCVCGEGRGEALE